MLFLFVFFSTGVLFKFLLSLIFLFLLIKISTTLNSEQQSHFMYLGIYICQRCTFLIIYHYILMSFAYILSLFYTANIFVCIASHEVD